MARPLKNPLSISAKPNFATGAREQEIAAEAIRRLNYAMWSYKVFHRHFASRLSLNDSLRSLRLALAKAADIESIAQTLYPDIEFALLHCAGQHALGRGQTTRTSIDFEAAARRIIETVPPRRGRPKDHVLRFHVEGVVALLHDTCGSAVRASLVKDGVYAPQSMNGLADLVITSFRRANTSLSETTIVNMMLDARRKHARKLLRFENFFPGYGAKVTLF